MATLDNLATTTTAKQKKPLYKDLFFQVIVAIILGVVVGHYYPEFAKQTKPLSDGFIKLIKMMIGPIIFCTIVTGIAGMENMKAVGRVGVKAIIYFEVLTTAAMLLGLAIGHIFKPGAGMNIVPDAETIAAVTEKANSKLTSTSDFFLNIIPDTFFSAFVHGEILQVLFVSLIFSGGVMMMGARGKPVVSAIQSFSSICFYIIHIIIKLAPIGTFGAMAYTVGKYGIDSLHDLGQLVLVFYGACLLFIVVILGSIMHFYCRLSTMQYLRYFKEEMMIVLGTASSETVLPRMMEKLTGLGCSKPIVGMVIPTGYSFNLDGSSLFMTLGALFIAYATGVELTWDQQVTLVGVLLLTSKGAAGIYGTAFVVLAATMSSLKVIPEESLVVGLALMFAVDRFMATGRAITNLIGNGIATIVIAKWEGGLNHNQAKRALANGYIAEDDPDIVDHNPLIEESDKK